MFTRKMNWILLTMSLLLAGSYFSLKKKESITPSPQVEIQEVAQQPPQRPEAPPPEVVSPSKTTVSVTQEAQSTERPSEALSEFRQLVEQAQSSMPRKKDLQNLSDHQVYSTPELIQRAVLNVGQIAQAIADNKELVPEGLKFYRDCAESEESPNSIRASCYFNHEELIKKFNLEEASLDNNIKISDRVRALAKTL